MPESLVVRTGKCTDFLGSTRWVGQTSKNLKTKSASGARRYSKVSA